MRRFERLNQLINSDCCIGITMAQCHVLLEIEENVEVTTTQLTDSLMLDKSTLSRTIYKLVQHGFIERRTNVSDRRYKLLALTGKGRRECAEINENNNNVYGSILNSVRNKSQDEIIADFELLVDAMNGSYKDSANKTYPCR